MSDLRYKFKIPDPARPIGGNRPPWGPFCELVDFQPKRLTADGVIGRVVCEVSTCAGTYGMGGPGFFGLRLMDELLIMAVWGVASWVQVDGRPVRDMFWSKNGRPRPWITDQGDELTGWLVGQPITAFEVAERTLTVGIGARTLSLSEPPAGHSMREVNKQARGFEGVGDLTQAVFLSPTTEIWI